jgi:D-beta-D-heptose 7-phosphate kinase/D-beta-D-heptose 1-phosphate adenosyltransferase
MGAPLPIKNRLMVGDRQLARWDEHDECAPLVKIQIGHWDAVVVADYCKGAVGTTVEKFVKSFCGRVFIDTKGNPACWREVSSAVMFPNLKEYTDYSNEYCAGFDHVVFKRGAQGLTETVLDRLPGGTVFNGRECSYPSWARFVRNVSGAGDTVVAAYAYATLVGYPDPLAFANAAAAVVVEKPFTATASLQEVLERLKEVGYPNAQCQLAA